ncbi:SprT-like domain-containing protein Spartan [Thelohanellus kitauei]|uniref:SprT-like domain-containing protein Spartan n=1 Tax=Thelohanellus kitauei TaxID=669202 RepID=A0A0C2N032_THEKT|nr:SprT-like domain-containing protein Spartan [Thelohanellus kitauei]
MNSRRHREGMIEVTLILNEKNTEDTDSVIFIEEIENTSKKSIQKLDDHAIDCFPITDQILEYIDPNPDIHQLFVKFSNDYFGNALQAVVVQWSKRMTMCAGLCKYYPRNGFCTISLSQPLLQFRPRKDLVETLLHEMIHAYLFVTFQNTDHSGHGPKFIEHMSRINRIAGTNITVFHNFMDEVKFHKKHWWRCDGPCRNRRPFFGYCKRSMNRVPGPNDLWWKDHQKSCNGKFVKIKEPQPIKKSNESSQIPTIQKYFK